MIKVTEYSTAENSLIKKIVLITTKIQNDFPELSKYLNEMPVGNQLGTKSNPSLVSLNEYYDSLCCLYKSYQNNV